MNIGSGGDPISLLILLFFFFFSCACWGDALQKSLYAKSFQISAVSGTMNTYVCPLC